MATYNGEFWVENVSEVNTFVHGDYRQDNLLYQTENSDAKVMDWQISVAYDIDNGACVDILDGTALTCEAEACTGSVTYSWGAEVADSVQEIGYHQSRPSVQPRTSWVLPKPSRPSAICSKTNRSRKWASTSSTTSMC